MDLKITPSGQTIVKPTALGPGANTDTKLLIYGLFHKGRVLAQDAVDAADALFHPHGVPRHVVVDQGATELEIQALGGGVRTQQNIGLAVAKPPFGIVAADPAPGAVGGGDFSTAPREAHQPLTSVLQKLFTQEIHGVGVLSEDHRLLVAVLVKLGEGALQAFELAVRWQLADVDKEAFDVGLL